MKGRNLKYILVTLIIFQSVFGFFWTQPSPAGFGGQDSHGVNIAYAATGLSATADAISSVSVNTTGTIAWASAVGVTSSDGVYAQVTAATFDANAVSETLRVSSTAFSIPSNATITGIVVEMEKSKDNGGVVDEVVRIIKKGLPLPLNKASTTPFT